MSSASPSSNIPASTTTQQPNLGTSKSTNASSQSTTSGREAPKNDLEKANFMKDDANQLVKQGKHGEACEKYFEAINTIRFSEKFKNTNEGKQAEMACRLNIALCKQTTGDYASVVD